MIRLIKTTLMKKLHIVWYLVIWFSNVSVLIIYDQWFPNMVIENKFRNRSLGLNAHLRIYPIHTEKNIRISAARGPWYNSLFFEMVDHFIYFLFNNLFPLWKFTSLIQFVSFKNSTLL